MSPRPRPDLVRQARHGKGYEALTEAEQAEKSCRVNNRLLATLVFGNWRLIPLP